MLFEFLWIFFWALTYCVIIFFGIKHRNSECIFMPLVAGSLNFACEIVSFIVKFKQGYIWNAHLLCILLDIFIFAHNVRILKKQNKRPLLYLILTSAVTVLLYYIFFSPYPNPMLYSIFLIDLEMAIVYLLEVRKIAPFGRTTIGILRFFGDFFAWLAYLDDTPFVLIIGAIITLLNLFYLSYCLELDTRQRKKKKLA